MAGAQIWPYLVLWVKFQIADQTVGTLSKFWSGWYIILPICTKENHPQSDCPQVLSVLPLYGIVSTHRYRIQNPLENPVRTMYRSLVEVIFCCNVILSCGWSTNIAISGSVGQISNFWSDSWNPLKILVRMIYNTFYSGKKKKTPAIGLPPGFVCSTLIWHSENTWIPDSESSWKSGQNDVWIIGGGYILL